MYEDCILLPFIPVHALVHGSTQCEFVSSATEASMDGISLGSEVKQLLFYVLQEVIFLLHQTFGPLYIVQKIGRVLWGHCHVVE